MHFTTVALLQWSTGTFSVRAHRTIRTIGQWLTSQALPLIIGGDFEVEPKQLEDSGWVRAVGHSSPWSRRRIESSISSLSLESLQALVKQPRKSPITLHPQARENRQLHAADTTQEVGYEAEALAAGQTEWMQEAGV